MKVDAAQYIVCGSYMPFAFDYSLEFTSLAQCAGYYREILIKSPQDAAFFLWLDNWRFMYVTKTTCDVHYHFTFDNSDLKRGEKMPHSPKGIFF